MRLRSYRGISQILSFLLLLSTWLPSTSQFVVRAAPAAPADTPILVVNDGGGFIVSDGLIYWALGCSGGEFRGDGYLRRQPVAGGTIRTLATVDRTNCVTFRNMTSDASGVFYYNDDYSAAGGVVGRLEFRPTDSPYDPPTPLIDLMADQVPLDYTRLAFDKDFVYWLSGSLFRVRKNGTDFAPVVTGLGNSVDLVVVGNTVYWLDDTGVWEARTDCSPLPCEKTKLTEAKGSRLGGDAHGLLYNEFDSGPFHGHAIYWTGWRSGVLGIHVYSCLGVFDCSASTVYTAPTDLPWRLGPPATDGVNLFWTEGWLTLVESGGRLRRMPRSGGTAVDIVVNTSYQPYRVFTDNKFVYFPYTQEPASGLFKLPLNASPIPQDLLVDAVEVTQGIQSLTNDSPLVAHKPTYVRAFARQASGTNARAVEGWLYGERDGSPLPGSPLLPLNGVRSLVTGAGYDRADVNSGWLFQLPESWLGPGLLHIRLVVDPRKAYYDLNRVNNENSGTINFGDKGPLCTIFIPVRTEAPTPSTAAANFWPMIDYAKRLWPIGDYRVYKQDGEMEELEICYWRKLFGVPIPYPCYGPYELPDDSWKVFATLWQRDLLTNDPDECDSGTIHYVGMVHSSTDTGKANGEGMTSVSNYAWVKFSPDTPLAATDPFAPKAGATLAHELAHNLGRQHVNCGDPPPDNPDDRYPYPNNQIGDIGNANHYGFDVKTRTVIPPDHASDLMSYCNPRWISHYNWKAIHDEVPGLATDAASVDPDVILSTAANAILVTGSVTPTQNTGDLGYAYNFPTSALNARLLRKWQTQANTAQAATTAANYRVRLLDAASNVLTDQQVTPATYADDSNPPTTLPFIATFPAPTESVARIELLQDSTVIASRTPGAATPSVTISIPAGGETVEDTIQLTWLGNDPNPNDILFYSVQYSPDNGQSWRALLTDFVGPPEPETISLNLKVLGLPGSLPNSARIRVAASDGYNTGFALSQPFTVNNRKPEPAIITPGPGATMVAGQAFPLRGVASDAEDGGLRGSALSWTLDGGPIGVGEEVNVSGGLAPGDYSLLLTARDSLSQTATASTTLRIRPLSIPATSSAELDGFCDDDSYGSGTQIQLAPYSDGAQASVQLVRSSDALWACFSGLKPGAATPGAFVGLRVDRNFSHDDLAQADDVGFFVNEDGGVSALQGDGAGNFVRAGTAGFQAQVSNSGETWSAELRIDKTALGGWEHSIGLDLGHYWVGFQGNDYHWPYAAAYNQPKTWAQTALGNQPTITGIEPATITAGGVDFTVTVSGTNFTNDSVILFDGVALPTTFLGSTLLQANVATSNFALPNTSEIMARNVGNLDSNPLLFEVVAPEPVINGLSPNTVQAEGVAFTLLVNGAGFVNGAKVLWNGAELPTTFVNTTQLTAPVDAAHIAQGQNVTVVALNYRTTQKVGGSILPLDKPFPDGQVSNSSLFVVTQPAAPPEQKLFLPLVQR